jgi:Protein of unknown function (DUF3263)
MRAQLRILVFRARSGQDRALMTLTEAQRALLDFERSWWQLPTSKTSEIRIRFGFSSSSYYRALYSVVDLPAAEAYDPLTVRRVRRRREQSRRDRIEGRRADPGSR